MRHGQGGRAARDGAADGLPHAAGRGDAHPAPAPAAGGAGDSPPPAARRPRRRGRRLSAAVGAGLLLAGGGIAAVDRLGQDRAAPAPPTPAGRALAA
ncbi:hypothetical protein OIM90_09680 [Streptomyces sp. AD16]|nr:hypothetical protein OIM90_09680 [Streptomyces sp. AD16]